MNELNWRIEDWIHRDELTEWISKPVKLFSFSLVVYINFASLCSTPFAILLWFNKSVFVGKSVSSFFPVNPHPFFVRGESRGRIRDRVWSRILSHQVLRKEPFLLLSLSPFQGQTSRERLEKRRESLGPTETTRTPTVPLSFFPIRTEYYSALSTLTHARTLTYADSRTLRHLVAATTSTHA